MCNINHNTLKGDIDKIYCVILVFIKNEAPIRMDEKEDKMTTHLYRKTLDQFFDETI